MTDKPIIGLVQGDPAGIGSELMIKLLSDNDIRDRADIVIIGAPSVIARGETIVGKTIDRTHVGKFESSKVRSGLQHIDLHIEGIEDVPIAEVSAEGGKSSLEGLKLAFELSSAKKIDGICFMPFNKESMHLGGNPFMDEIGFARDYFGVDTAASEFNIAHGMWNGRVTSHVAMKDVPSMLSEERICQSIELAHNTLKLAGYERPRIVVAAYNPHAGEGGLMGTEEVEYIRPAVEKMQQRQMHVSGPFPADTLWLKVRDREYDVVVTMYHDQGQIAIKLLGFDQGVSLLAGLPVPITTPAHGTAFDIAGTNQANLDPARNAFNMCCDLAEGLTSTGGWYKEPPVAKQPQMSE
ncbi:MAG: 4-hydroxythreonine-4-phosphate dehydrogenase PdxA [Gammaproteobacteria bacterium]|nr:4-hydroxythreonine-4-phosphate dehydrogenase PdxA [Gammaproteobacteria bacterium]